MAAPPPVALRETLRRSRSENLVVHSGILVKQWASAEPAVDAVRPGACPRCGAASRPPGEPVGLVGHGLRERQVLGPAAANAPAGVTVVRVRRYRCRACAAVVTVVPRDLLARRHYAAGAIALALFGYGLLRQSATTIRRAVSPRTTHEEGWPALHRWLRQLGDGKLYRGLGRAVLAYGSHRRRAEAAASALMGFAAGPFASDAERVFAGAALAA